MVRPPQRVNNNPPGSGGADLNPSRPQGSSSSSAAGPGSPGPGPARKPKVLRARMRLRFHGVADAYSSNFVMLLAVVLLLVVIGLVMVLSSSAIDSYTSSDSFFTIFFRQAMFALMGVPAMLIVSRLSVATIRRWAWPFFGIMLLVQALVFSPLGNTVNGNRNWLRLGPISVQPSEVLKIALILWLASVLSMKEKRLTSLREIAVPALIGSAIAIGLVLLGSDLGTSMVMIIAVFGCLLFARVPMRFFAFAGIIAGGGVLILALIRPSRLARIAQFLEPECTNYLSTCWQSVHGEWALAMGGVFGVGLGNSTVKWDWLPEAENDFIFAIIGEELGLIGALTVVLLFAFLAFVMARIITSAPDAFSKIFVGGVLVWVIAQAFINIAVVIGLLPVLGVPLPFISSGGSALISSLVAMGMVLAVARANPTPVVGRPVQKEVA